MNKLDKINKKNFDKIEYINKYNKNKYRNISLRILPDDYTIIDNYCKKIGKSKAQTIVKSIKYCIEHDIKFDD